MKTIDRTQKIDVEALKSQLATLRTIPQRFKLPLSEQQAYDALLAAYQTEVANRQANFVCDPMLEKNIAAMAKALTQNNPKFGIMLCGTCGNGKTTLLRAFQLLLNFLNRKGYFEQSTGIRIVDAKDISALMREPHTKTVRNTPMLAIEDMGREATEVLDYGNVLSPVVDLLEYRYNEQLFTFITTNLNAKDVRQKYGARIADRFNEMLCVIPFTASSFRGKTLNT